MKQEIIKINVACTHAAPLEVRNISFDCTGKEVRKLLSFLVEKPLFPHGYGAGGWMAAFVLTCYRGDHGINIIEIDNLCRYWRGSNCMAGDYPIVGNLSVYLLQLIDGKR